MEALARVLSAPETLSCGCERDLFEEEFRAFVGTAHAVAVTSCTTGIEFVLRLLRLKPGDKVLSTPQTYQSTVSALLGTNVDVRFVDIDPNTLCASPQSVCALADAETRAILVTHYGGIPVDMAPLCAIAETCGAVIIEDCAHAHGAVYQGRKAGNLGHFGVFSFQSMKNMSTLGQGGMICTDDGDFAQRLRRIRAVEPDADFSAPASDFGYTRDPENIFTHSKNAFEETCTALHSSGGNATLAEPAAAVGRVQLTRLPDFTARRSALKAAIDAVVEEIPELSVQRVPAGSESANHLYTCFLDDTKRYDARTVCSKLAAFGIEIQQRYFPLHLLPEWRYRNDQAGQCPIAERVWFERQINLPLYPAMQPDDVGIIRDGLKSVFG